MLQPELSTLPAFMLGLYLSRSAGPLFEDLFNLSRIIPLWKDPEGQGLRPIAIPTAWRKLASLVLLRRWQGNLRDAAGPWQFAAGSPDGTCRFASAVKAAMQEADQGYTLLRTDISNAFGSVHRGHLSDLLHGIHPEVAAAFLPWLHRPTLGVVYDNHGNLHAIPAHRGIPQGDPLSSIAFCIVMARPLAEFQARPSGHCLALGYADDVILRTPTSEAATALNAWTAILAPSGLAVNAAKTAIWTPSPEIPDSLRHRVGPQAPQSGRYHGMRPPPPFGPCRPGPSQPV